MRVEFVWTYELSNDPSHEEGYYHVWEAADEADFDDSTFILTVLDTPELDKFFQEFCDNLNRILNK